MSAPPVPPAPPARNFRLTVLMLVGLVAGAYLAFGIATAKQTLGCDFQVYRAAADRFLAGLPLYDTSISSTGSCNLFYYPPSFVALVVPFAVLGETLGNAAWIAFLVVSYVVGCALLPVRWEVKLAVFLAGAVSWPFIFGVRIGQVAPILYLLFAVGWRWLERRPAVTGFAVGLGVLVKLQPIVIVGWLVVRRMWSGLAGVAAAGVVAAGLAIVGLGAWIEMVSVLRNLDNAITAPTNVSLGAIAYQHGLPLEAASLLGIVGILARGRIPCGGRRVAGRLADHLDPLRPDPAAAGRLASPATAMVGGPHPGVTGMGVAAVHADRDLSGRVLPRPARGADRGLARAPARRDECRPRAGRCVIACFATAT